MFKLITKIAVDKYAHALFGLLVAVAVWLLLYKLADFAIWEASLVSIAISAVVGVAKEAWDACSHRTSDSHDVFATVIGGVVGVIIVLLILFLV